MAAKPHTPFPRVKSVGKSGIRFTAHQSPAKRMSTRNLHQAEMIKISGRTSERQEKTVRLGKTLPSPLPPLSLFIVFPVDIGQTVVAEFFPDRRPVQPQPL